MRQSLVCPTLSISRAVVAAFLIFLGMLSNARAADFGWDDGAANDLWTSSANWLPDGVPGLVDAISLTGTSAAGPQTIDLGGVTQRIDHVVTNGVGGTYTLTNGTLEIFGSASVILANDGGGGMVFDNDLLFAVAAERFINTSTTGSPIVVNGDITTSAASGTMTLNLTSRNVGLDPSVQVNGVIADGAGARMALTAGYANDAANHRGVVSVTNLNTFTGPTRINGAILQINSIENVGGPANALGQPALADSAISFGTTVDTDPVTAVLRYVGTGHTTDRDIVLAGKDNDNAFIDASGTGPLVLNGNVLNPANGQTLRLGGGNTGENTLSGVINPGVGTDVTSLRKEGAGKWILSGDSSSIDGSLTVADGELVVTGALGSTTSSAQRLDISNGATFTLDGGFVSVGDLNQFAGGTLDFRSGELHLTAGNTTTGAGSFTIGTSGVGRCDSAAAARHSAASRCRAPTTRWRSPVGRPTRFPRSTTRRAAPSRSPVGRSRSTAGRSPRARVRSMVPFLDRAA